MSISISENNSQTRKSTLLFGWIFASFLVITSFSILVATNPESEVYLVTLIALLIGVQGARTNCGWNAVIRLPKRTNQSLATIASYGVGLVLGATTTALIVLALSSLLHPSEVLIGICFLVIAPFRILRPEKVVPGGWKVRREWEKWGTPVYLGVFGWFLGVGFITTMSSALFVVLALWGLGSGVPLTILAAYIAFAAGRMITSVATLAEPSENTALCADTAGLLRSSLKPCRTRRNPILAPTC